MMKKINDENKALGIIALGIFFIALGNGLTKYIKDISFKFIIGLIDGLGVGLEIVGTVMFAIGIASIIRIKKNKK